MKTTITSTFMTEAVHFWSTTTENNGQILSKAVESMNNVRDIDNYEDLIIRMPEIVTNDDTNDNAWEPYEESHVYTTDPSIAAVMQKTVLQLQPTCKESQRKEREYFENGMINVKGNTKKFATVSRLTNLTVAQVQQCMSNERKHYRKDYPGLLEKMEISGRIAKQIHNLKEQLHDCELNGKQRGAGALKHDLKELSKQLIHDLNEQLHECELTGKQPGAGALKYDLKELSKQLILPLLSIRFCQLTLESNIFQEQVLKLLL
ncbi:hypothetical protein BDD12DRAFT_883633 [Trichophaea hybrida]|nr:hypothetical protein BDD12DRAFT_883633 [Trichophaea hybrida]